MTGRQVVATGVGLAVDGLRGPADLLTPYQRHPGGFDPDTGLRGKRMRHRDRASRLASLAADAALDDAGLRSAEGAFLGTPTRTATVVSTNLGNLDSVCSFVTTIDEQSALALNSTELPNTSSNVTAGWLAIEHGLRAPNLTLSNGATSGLDALHWARTLIATGRADAAVVTGVEPDNEYVRRLHRDNDERSWPDAAAAVVLESADHAERRGARARLVLGPYQRATSADAALRAVLPAQSAAGQLLAEPALAADRPVLDLASWAGRQSGALGVLQCVAAAAGLDDPEGVAVAVSCQLPDAAVAAMAFHGPAPVRAH
ncbi:beta-ketoacyl synthase N-terminal-like domain-containing protein [Goodfellowiella coeruleoviolacea]|uniref:3-oxoacyl-[acyl-carrier-protein] synthase II n=1 Tax=Goodfellowiella coeruleoviolacea TaxID=334858 RepID=A0AAE3KEF0_9PSEU|nr:beta-ketoacyl synthase N-terminal-like domain-containing protein [Goodfellowiella coeruleoviolacea]MCP2163294.1 3-oxoacyl-[acyl-carrier-protein] synthase II [Goodfellowiella coeruleoviolacea]